MKRLTPLLIKQMAIGITGIVMQHTERDDLTLAYVRQLQRTLLQAREDPRLRGHAEAKRKVMKLIEALDLVEGEIVRREYGAT